MSINDISAQTSSAPRLAPAGRKLIGEILVMQGVINSKQLEQAHTRQKQGLDGKLPIGAIMVKLGFLTEEDITKARAIQLSNEKVTIGYAAPEIYANPIPTETVELVPAEMAVQHMLLPIGKGIDGRLRIVSTNWTSGSFEAAVKLATQAGMGLDPQLGTERNVKQAIMQHYGKAVAAVAAKQAQTDGANGNGDGKQNGGSAVPALIEDAPKRNAPPANLKASDVLSAARRAGQDVPGQESTLRNSPAEVNVDIQEFSVDQPVIIQFVNKIIKDGIMRRASDIHLEPLRNGMEIKYRIDGSLHSIDEVPKHYQSACVSRIKVMSEMNIAERRVPQDGRISVTLSGRQVDLRVSSLPTAYGEAVVLRILDRSSMKLDIDTLGFSPRNLKALKSVVSKPHGIFLATGPTGSGKTTTIYSALQMIRSPEINIITVEDPIEYELEGVRQSNTNEKAGLTFPKQLRAILRQDPDVIYVGEIRDPETAEIAFRAALTGHLVFTTLHCNDAAGAVTRLLNMGVDPFLIASSVIGVLAQRLVRKVCKSCGQPYQPGLDELASLGLDPKSEEVLQGHFMKGTGCSECDKSGYAGRYSVQELMLMDDTVRQLTLDRAPSTKIRQEAMSSPHNPMVPMRRDGAEKVLQGITSIEEVQKRVFLEDFIEE